MTFLLISDTIRLRRSSISPTSGSGHPKDGNTSKGYDSKDSWATVNESSRVDWWMERKK